MLIKVIVINSFFLSNLHLMGALQFDYRFQLLKLYIYVYIIGFGKIESFLVYLIILFLTA
jgi:hypothetical protein